ncbi:MAG TPA: TIM-barrel domain-containing protein [Verrucomicrobiae bacterium]|nr:TIM-barrel domain-containing protein [Verrucomicrobiae bacterium]
MAQHRRPFSNRTRGDGLLASLLAVSFIAASNHAQGVASSAFKKIDNGILVTIGKAQVELTAATPSAFCLGVSYNGDPNAAPSAFLSSPSPHSISWQLARSGDFVGVKTGAGELLINPASREWMLKDSSGQVLVPAIKLDNLDATDSETSHVSLSVGWQPGAAPAFYGCGNGMGQEIGSELPTIIGPETLQQTPVPTHLGNGVAVVPYYWSTAGYSALAVTANDNQPASWTTNSGEARCRWDFPGPKANLYLMPAANLEDAAKVYAQLTGYPPVPPRWTFGYMQSRWGWTNRAYIEDTLQQFINRKLPIDGLVFDVEWYTPTIDYALPENGSPDFNDFGWNPALFSEPAAQIAAYRAQGVHSVAIRKPRVGNSDVLQMLRKNHWDLPERQSVKGMLANRMIGYRNPQARDWYARQLGPLLETGIAGWWNDEGEATYTTYHYWIMAEQKAQTKFKPDTRLWTINRAFSPGLQRLGAAAWTGDIEAIWPQLRRTATDLLNWGLAGMPYTTCDIGGFRDETQPELLTRWIQAGVFYPILRAHSRIDVKAHFPWLFGPEAENAIHKALDLRYRLIPYYYSLAHETHLTGVPFMRPLVMEFPHDPNVANLSDQWLMGDGLMAAPILSQSNQRSVYLPSGDWYQFDTNTKINGGKTITATAALDQIPLYVRAGTILPLGQMIQHTDQLPGGPLELQVYPGQDATFKLVEDDGQTTDYLKGIIRQTTFTWNDSTHRLSWEIEGPYHGKDIFTEVNIKVFYPNGIKAAKGSLLSKSSARLPN